MKKSLKISTMILASSMLMSGGGAFLANSFNSQQNTSILNYQSAEARTDTVQNSEIIYKTLPENLTMSANGLVYKDGSEFYLFTSMIGAGVATAYAENLELLIDLEQFPADAIFKMTSQVPGETFDTSSQYYYSVDLENSTYSFNLYPSKYYENGQIMENISDYNDPTMKFFEVVIDVSPSLNSRIKFKQIPVDLDASNINDKLFLNESAFNMVLFLQMFELIDFPGGDIIFFRAVGVYGSYDAEKLTYTINVYADKSYENSKIVGNRHVPAVVQGLKQHADSAVTEKTLNGTKYNLNNISGLLGTTTVNMDNLAEVVTLVSFPSDTTFTIENPNEDAENGIYTSSLKPSKYYLNDNVVDNTSNPAKTFPIKISGLKVASDSNVLERVLPPYANFNLNNISGILGTTTVNASKLAEAVVLVSFPSDATFTIENPNVDFENGVYTSTLKPSKYYLNGIEVDNTIANPPKTFHIRVSGLKAAPDSNVLEKELTGTKYNLNNIADLLGTDTVNMTNLAEIAELADFPTVVIFTIENVKLDFVNGTYTSDLKPSKYFAGGFEIVNDTNPAKTFEIKVSGLKGVENSEVINKQIPGDIDLNNVQDKLKNADGNTVNRDVLGHLIDLTAFPENTAFTADFANSITDQNAGIYTLNITANKQYVDGKAVDQPKNFELKLQGFYVAPAPTAEDNTGLTVGLVIGGVVLVLLLVGLYIWNKKRIQAAGETPDGKDGKAKAEKSKQAKDLAGTEVKTNDSIKIAKTEGSLDQSNVANPAQVNDHNPIELGENKHSAEPTSSEAKNDKAPKTSKTKSLSPNKTTNIDKPKSNPQATKKLNASDDYKKSSQQTSSTAKNDKVTKTSKTKSLSPNKTTNIDKPKSNPQATKKLNASDDHKKSSQQTSTEAKNDKTAKTSNTKSLSPDQTTSKNTNIDKPKSNPQATEKLNASDDHKPESVNETKPIDEAKVKDSDKKS